MYTYAYNHALQRQSAQLQKQALQKNKDTHTQKVKERTINAAVPSKAK